MKRIQSKFFLGLLSAAVLLVFSGCNFDAWQKTGVEKGNQESLLQKAPEEKKPVPKDQIDFSDPGDDELGKEVEELDKLINQTAPSEYSDSALSDEELSEDIELQ
jgi:hypothetical protein